MIQILKALVLGIIQGLTEFLPVSSSGHLVLAQHFMNYQKPNISFETILHLGSLLAVLIYFRKDILDLIKSPFISASEKKKKDLSVLLYLSIATLITGILGFLLKDKFEEMFTHPLLASLMLVVTGFILIFSDMISKTNIPIYKIGVKRSIFIGLAQTFAIIPGISRSGTTIAVSIYNGIKREDAAKFSFLLSIPAILGANISEFSSLKELSSTFVPQYIIGAVAAFVSGYLVIAFLISVVKKQKLKYFSIYCWIVALISGILILSGY